MVNFRTEKISDRVTRIYAVCTELMYLVECDEKAALLDTGSGFGSHKDDYIYGPHGEEAFRRDGMTMSEDYDKMETADFQAISLTV